MVSSRICCITFPRSSSLFFLRLGPMSASFLSLWASLKVTVSSHTVTPVSLSGAAAPLDLEMSSWPRSHQSGSFSTEGNSSHFQALPLGSEAELRAKWNRKKQVDTEKAEETNPSVHPLLLCGVGSHFPSAEGCVNLYCSPHILPSFSFS